MVALQSTALLVGRTDHGFARGTHVAPTECVESILACGLEINRTENRFNTADIIRPLYGCVPAYVCVSGAWPEPMAITRCHRDMTVLDIDITDLPLAPDVPSVGSHTHHYDANGLIVRKRRDALQAWRSGCTAWPRDAREGRLIEAAMRSGELIRRPQLKGWLLDAERLLENEIYAAALDLTRTAACTVTIDPARISVRK